MRPSTSTVWTSLLLVGHAAAAAVTPRDATSAQIPPAGINITDLAADPDRLHDAFTSYSATGGIAKRAYATTANELTDGTACRAVTVIYARGTTQDGNIGASGDVGPLFLNNLSSLVGAAQLAVQGVDYAADVLGFLQGGDAKGSQKMADLVALAHTQCPSTEIVLSGYSQGGQLVHNAADLLASNTAAVNQVAAGENFFLFEEGGGPPLSNPFFQQITSCVSAPNLTYPRFYNSPHLWRPERGRRRGNHPLEQGQGHLPRRGQHLRRRHPRLARALKLPE